MSANTNGIARAHSPNGHALHIAREIFYQDPYARRGLGEWRTAAAGTVGFFLYDNHPFALYPGLRDQHCDALVAFMATRGCRLQEDAHYPTAGEEAGFTRAMIFVSATPQDVKSDLNAAADFIQEKLADMSRWPRPEEAARGAHAEPGATNRASGVTHDPNA